MTSGEWDLNALKELEEEEQKEFLALSQKNLYDPPSPPGAPARLLQSTTANAQPATINYATLQQQYKLPTISECQAAVGHRRHNSGSATPNSLPSSSGMSVLSAARLKLSRALSLSAHSLSGGRVGSTPLNERAKTGLHAHSLYTPPPVRRCATLHHMQPVRKTFKTLHQLEQQKQASNQQHALNTPPKTQSSRKQGLNKTLVGTHKSPSLRRVVGTNKTYWKYGITPASSFATVSNNKSGDLESLASDDYGSDDLTASMLNCRDAGLVSDAETESVSCSVPVVGDSMEMMRILLNSASTSVKIESQITITTSKPNTSIDSANEINMPNIINNGDNNAVPSAAATGVSTIWPDDWAASSMTTATGTSTLRRGNLGSARGSTATSSHVTAQPTTNIYDPHETVAYEAFHAALARRKSFSNKARNIYSAAEPTQNYALTEQNLSPTVNLHGKRTAAMIMGSNQQGLYKSASLDIECPEGVSYMGGGVAGAGAGNGVNMLRSTIITNPIMQNMPQNLSNFD